MIFSIFGAYISAVCYAILLHVQKKHIFICGIVGAIGSFINLIITQKGYSPVLATFCGSIVVTQLSYFLARRRKTPVTVFLISGIIPLVPGIWLYRTMYYLLFQEFNTALSYFILTFEIAGVIAGSIILVTLFPRLWRKT